MKIVKEPIEDAFMEAIGSRKKHSSHQSEIWYKVLWLTSTNKFAQMPILVRNVDKLGDSTRFKDALMPLVVGSTSINTKIAAFLKSRFDGIEEVRY